MDSAHFVGVFDRKLRVATQRAGRRGCTRGDVVRNACAASSTLGQREGAGPGRQPRWKGGPVRLRAGGRPGQRHLRRADGAQGARHQLGWAGGHGPAVR